MITLTQLAPGIVEMAVLDQPSDEDMNDALAALDKRTRAGPVVLLGNFSERTAHQPLTRHVFEHIAPHLAGRFTKIALIGDISDEERESIAKSFGARTAIFDDKPSAIAWLRR